MEPHGKLLLPCCLPYLLPESKGLRPTAPVCTFKNKEWEGLGMRKYRQEMLFYLGWGE